MGKSFSDIDFRHRAEWTIPDEFSMKVGALSDEQLVNELSMRPQQKRLRTRTRRNSGGYRQVFVSKASSPPRHTRAIVRSSPNSMKSA
jgi:hypothetical protein